MTTIEAYVDRVSKNLVSTIGGALPPTINIVLGEFLALNLAWLKAGGVVEALPDNTPVTMVIKPKLEQDAEPLALDVTADVSGDGSACRYVVKAQIDCQALRDALEGKERETFMLQITWGAEGTESFGAAHALEITVEQNYSRDGDAVPDPLTNAGWAKIKAFIPESDSVTHNEDDKTIAIEAGGGVSDHGALSGLEDDDHPQYHTDERADERYAPITHGDSHGVAGSDPIEIAQAQVTGLEEVLGAKANLENPNFPDGARAATQSAGDNSTKLATTAFVKAAITALVNSSPAALDTLNELAAALGNDQNFAATMTTALAGKVPNARTISGGGLATGGGDLSANRTITVPVASQAEAEAGADNTKAMTPQSTKQAIDALAGNTRTLVVNLAARLALNNLKIGDIVVQTGRVEISTITTLGNAGNVLNGAWFTLADAAGSVAFWFSGGVHETASFDFTGINGAALVTNADGLFVVVETVSGTPHTFWFNTGTENAPSAGVGVLHEVAVLAGDTDTNIRDKFVTAVLAELGTEVSAVNTTSTACDVTDLVVGAHTSSSGGTSGVVVSVTRAGQTPAAEPAHGCSRSLLCTLGDDGLNAAEDVADGIRDVATLDGAWGVVRDGDDLTFTDVALGARADIADGGVATGFAFAVTQQGEPPGGTFMVVDPANLNTRPAWAVLTLDSE